MSGNVIVMRGNDWLTNGLKTLCSTLVNRYGDRLKSMVEIGAYAGESTLIFRNGLPNVVIRSIDPWQNGFDDKDPASHSDMRSAELKYDKIASENPKIIKYKGVSSDFHNFPEFQKVHFVYIDGSHAYKDVKADIDFWLPRCKLAIAGHDYTCGNAWAAELRRAVDEGIGGKPDMTFEDMSWIKFLQ